MLLEEQKMTTAQLTNTILGLFSIDALNVTMLTGQRVLRLIETGLVSEIIDIFMLERYRSSVSMVLFKEYPVKRRELITDKLLREIEASRMTSLSRFITGLSIPGINYQIAERITFRYNDFIERIIYKIDGCDQPWTLRSLLQKNINYLNVEQAIEEWLENIDNVKMILDLIIPVEWLKTDLTYYGKHPLSGLTIYFYCHNAFYDKALIRKKILALGGRVSDRLNDKVDIVISDQLPDHLNSRLNNFKSVDWSFEDLDSLFKPCDVKYKEKETN